ncbi:hypothetical protein ACWC09_09360 [Streptomyces sp. NPDC001617]
MRQIARGLVTAGAVLVGTLAMPGTAHAAGTTVKDAYSDGRDWSVLDVRLEYSGGIDKITAMLRPVGSSDTDPPVATVTDFTKKYDIYSWDGVWASQPIHLDALGKYTVDFEVTDSSGETTVQKNAGTLNYAKQPVFSDFTVTPTEPDFEHRTATATGDLVLRDPRTRETVPLAGTDVDVQFDNGAKDTPVVTDDVGHFSASRETTGGWAIARYSGDLGYVTSDSADVWPQAAPTRFVLDQSDFHVTTGDKITVAGTLQYQYDGEWRPLTGTPVEMNEKDSSTYSPVDTTTDANGRFSFGLSASIAKSVYEISVPTSPFNPYIVHTTADVTVAATATTKFSSFTASLDKYAQVTINGTLDVTGRGGPDSANVDIQYSADGKTGWTTQTTLKVAFGNDFTDRLPGYTDGYWRLSYAGSTTKDIKGTVSNSLRRNRALTRVKDANASPEPVYKGRTITVKGVLQEHKVGATSWNAYGGKKVQILFRPKGTSTWYLMATVTTKTNGSFSKGFTAKQDGTWVPVFLYPDSKHFVGEGREDYVDVR